MKNKFETSLKLIPVVFISALTIFIFTIETNAAPLRAGVSKISITKDKPTGLINDTLYAKALLLDDGKTKAVVITMDILNISFKDLNEIRTRIQNDLKINGNNVMINVSHNHWVNDQLAEDYVPRTVKAVKEASLKMVPVKVGEGTGIEKRITMNRRLILTNGKEWTIRRATPEPEDQMVKGIAEPFDPEIGILRLDNTDGKPLAVLYTFAGHNYTGIPNRAATAGFPGFASKVIEESLGNGVVALFMQGSAGDITPILYKDVNTPKQDEMMGTMLGLSTLQAWRNISSKKNTGLSIIREELSLPGRNDIQSHIDSLEAKKTIILDYFKGEGCGAHGAGTKLNFKTFIPLYIKYMMSPQYPSDYSYRYLEEKKIGINDLEMMDTDNKRDIEKYLNNIYKMEELIVTEANLGYLKSSKPQEHIKAEITGLKIGGFVLISFSGEVFAQVGLNIKKASPYEYTFVSGYTNGSVGYSPTPDAYNGDAYEVSLSALAPEWQKIFEEKALEIIKKL
jgi:hypothetical protein